MIINRAMSNIDMENYNNNNNIRSTLFNSYIDINNRDKNERKIILECCKKYFENYRENALDGMIGHVSGAKFKCDRSPWISGSTDFDFVACEYAVPQAGKYNWFNIRKPIALIDYDDDLVYDDITKIFSLRKTYTTNFAIDLSDDKLKKLYDLDIIGNETSFGYTFKEDGKIIKNKIDGINNFSTSAKEILMFGEIKLDNIKLMVYPILQDIVYSCNIDINHNINFFIKNYKKINKIVEKMIKNDAFFAMLYPDVKTGIPLTDILENCYSQIPGNNIEDKYNELKKLKLQRLFLLVNELNKNLKTNWKIEKSNENKLIKYKLVDNKIIVCMYNKLKTYTKRQLNDIILIEKNNDIYRYSHKEKTYIKKNNQKI